MTAHEFEDFGQQIADACEAFLLGVQAVAREEEAGSAVPLLLLEVSQLLLAGARLGAQQDFEPETEYQPDVGPDPDLDALRLLLAEKLGPVDTYSDVFDPYDPETFTSSLADDLTSIATDIANGLRHFRAGNTEEALWWWQYSYLASWGSLAISALGALHSVVAHDRLDADVDESDQIEAAEELLEGGSL